MPPWRSSTSCHWLRQTKSLDQCLWPFCLKYDCNVLSSALQISCPSANIPQLSNRTTRRQIHKTIPLMFVVGSQDLSGCKHLTLCGTALHKPHANQTKKNNTLLYMSLQRHTRPYFLYSVLLYHFMIHSHVSRHHTVFSGNRIFADVCPINVWYLVPQRHDQCESRSLAKRANPHSWAGIKYLLSGCKIQLDTNKNVPF